MPQIFVSYRRGELSDLVDRIFDALVARFGRDTIFRDIDSIAPATNFADQIGEALRECKVMVALIGPDWLARTADGGRRIDHDDDWVRTEIHIGLVLKLPLIPVLLNQANMPSQSELPRPLAGLSALQALQLGSGRNFQPDVERLVEFIGRYVKSSGKTSSFTQRFLTARTSEDLVRLKYEIDAHLQREPNDVDARAIRDKIEHAIHVELTRQASPTQYRKFRLPTGSLAGLLAFAVILITAPTYFLVRSGPITQPSRPADEFINDPIVELIRPLSSAEYIAIQRALCVPDSDVWPRGSLPAPLVKIYMDTINNARTGDVTRSDGPKLTSSDVARLRAAGPCDTGKYRNYFERTVLSNPSARAALVSLLNRIPTGTPLAPEASDVEIRSRIAETRVRLGLHDVPDQMADQATPDLIKRLRQN